MTAQAADRDPKLRAGGTNPEVLPGPVPLAANVVLYKGAMVAADTSGNARPARSVAANSDVTIGFSMSRVSNSGGSAGDVSTDGIRQGVIEVNNDGSDPVGAANLFRNVYAVDDQTVSAGSNGSTRVVAGKLMGFDADSGKPLVKVGV